MLINDKSELKRNVEQIGFQLVLKTSKSLSWSDRLRQILTDINIHIGQRKSVQNL